MKITYETEPCSRCGGSGRHSYCPAYGYKCFQCDGSGIQRSRKGTAAYKKVHLITDEMYSVPASELKVGDRVFYSHKWRTVTWIGESTSCSYLVDGVSFPNYEIHFPSISTCFRSMEEKFRRFKPFTEEQVAKIKTFKGCTIEE